MQNQAMRKVSFAGPGMDFDSRTVSEDFVANGLVDFGDVLLAPVLRIDAVEATGEGFANYFVRALPDDKR